MKLMETMKTAPLGIPMTVASFGTAASLLAGKKLHTGFGIAWLLLSLWHGPSTEKSEMLSPWKQLLASLQVVSFIEGRVRLRSPWFLNNEKLKKQMEEYIVSFTGVTKATINVLTGSLLIEYQPETLRTKPRLASLEKYLAGEAISTK